MNAPAPTPPRARRRRRRWPWVLGAFVLLLIWGAVAAMQLNSARRSTQAGVDRLQEARDVLTPTGLVQGEGVDILKAAHRDFQDARDQVRSPLVAPLRVLPVVGRQVRSVDSMTGAAAEVVDAGIDALEESSDELRQGQPRGPERVVIAKRLAAISSEAHQRIIRIDLGPNDALIAPLRDARRKFARELRQLESATQKSAQASRGMADFLEGPSTYLVFAANNNEMRVGSGTFLSVGVLTVRDGTFDLGDMTPASEFELPQGAVKLTGDFAKRWGWLQPNQEWRNLASSPVFPTQATLAARMWRALGNKPIDGVLALDPVALRALIQATHPVVIDGKQYGPNNVLEEIYLNQYRDIQGYPENQERRDRLSDIAREAIQSLEDGEFETVDLVDALRSVADGRHILGWGRDKAQQSGWSAAGIAGTMERDSLLLGIHNRGGNKLDQFLQVNADLTTTEDAKGTAVRVQVRMQNNTPNGLPQYVSGPYPNAIGTREGLYQGLLVAELPEAARDWRITGPDGKRLPLVAAGRDGGSFVVAAYVEAERGQVARASVHFRLPKDATTLQVEPSARMPAIEWAHNGDQWRDESSHDIAW